MKTFLLLGIPFLFFITLKTHRTHCGEGDEPHYLLIAESLIDDGDIEMTNQYPDVHAFVPQWDLASSHTIPDRFGGRYPFHDLGLPVLLVPALSLVHAGFPYIPQKVLNAMRLKPEKLTITVLAYQSILVTCVLTFLLFLYLKQASFPEHRARWGAWLAVLTLPIATHAYLFFTEIYSAVGVLAGVLLLRREHNRLNTCLFSLIVFVLLALHTRNLLLCAGLVGLWAWRTNGVPPTRWRRWAPLVALAFGIAVRSALNGHFLGKFSLSAPLEAALANYDAFSLRFIPRNATGFLVDRKYGLVWNNPLFLVIPVGLWSLFKRRRDGWFCESALVVPFIGLLLVFRFWDAGWAPADRFWVAIVPLLWLPIFEGLCLLWDNRGKPLALLLLVGSLLVAGLHWQYPRRFWVESADTLNPWMSVLSFGDRQWQTLLPDFVNPGPHFVASTGISLLLVFMVVSLSFKLARRI